MTTCFPLKHRQHNRLLIGLSLLVGLGAAETLMSSQAETNTLMAQSTVNSVQAATESQPAKINEDNTFESHIKQQASLRWQALIQRDFAKVYEFNTPAYRTLYSKEQFESNFGTAANWTAANVEKITIKKATVGTEKTMTAKVLISLQYQLAIAEMRQNVSTTLTENWILRDKDWWYVPDFE